MEEKAERLLSVTGKISILSTLIIYYLTVHIKMDKCCRNADVFIQLFTLSPKVFVMVNDPLKE